MPGDVSTNRLRSHNYARWAGLFLLDFGTLHWGMASLEDPWASKEAKGAMPSNSGHSSD